jgi:hypothetical protein
VEQPKIEVTDSEGIEGCLGCLVIGTVLIITSAVALKILVAIGRWILA